MEQERLALARLGRAITAVWLSPRVALLLAAVVAQMLLAAQAQLA
jgi:preprotein translocase subunit Sec61beta